MGYTLIIKDNQLLLHYQYIPHYNQIKVATIKLDHLQTQNIKSIQPRNFIKPASPVNVCKPLPHVNLSERVCFVNFHKPVD